MNKAPTIFEKVESQGKKQSRFRLIRDAAGNFQRPEKRATAQKQPEMGPLKMKIVKKRRSMHDHYDSGNSDGTSEDASSLPQRPSHKRTVVTPRRYVSGGAGTPTSVRSRNRAQVLDSSAFHYHSGEAYGLALLAEEASKRLLDLDCEAPAQSASAWNLPVDQQLRTATEPSQDSPCTPTFEARDRLDSSAGVQVHVAATASTIEGSCFVHDRAVTKRTKRLIENRCQSQVDHTKGCTPGPNCTEMAGAVALTATHDCLSPVQQMQSAMPNWRRTSGQHHQENFNSSASSKSNKASASLEQPAELVLLTPQPVTTTPNVLTPSAQPRVLCDVNS
mmetsp:Transcript_17465/g.33722  ORF Transcript_17465/g.33722 Transcript_17465/m.33722 type:complete len:334 (-) Transcript_17465:146-1147(-)